MTKNTPLQRCQDQTTATREALLMSENEFASDLVTSVRAVTLERGNIVALLQFHPDGAVPRKDLDRSSVIRLEENYGAIMELPDEEGKRWPAPLDEAQKETLSAYAQRAGRTLISLTAISSLEIRTKGKGLDKMHQERRLRNQTLHRTPA